MPFNAFVAASIAFTAAVTAAGSSVPFNAFVAASIAFTAALSAFAFTAASFFLPFNAFVAASIAFTAALSAFKGAGYFNGVTKLLSNVKNSVSFIASSMKRFSLSLSVMNLLLSALRASSMSLSTALFTSALSFFMRFATATKASSTGCE